MKSQQIPSNRSFGILFFFVFLIISLWPLLYQENLRLWSIIISLIFLFLGIFNSKILTPLNKVWIKFGLFLGNVISPIVMAIIFFGVVTPTVIVLRLFKKDVLKLKKNNSNSYWIEKDNSKNDMKNQF